MRISELSHRTGVSVRSLRYYEQKHLLTVRRLDNGYRDFDVDKPDILGNRESHENFLTWFNATFSGQTTIEDITAEENIVVVRATFHGIQKSEWNGRPPGQEATFTGITTFLIADGKIVEQWHKHLTW